MYVDTHSKLGHSEKDASQPYAYETYTRTYNNYLYTSTYSMYVENVYVCT
jgi:hypothetical protein